MSRIAILDSWVDPKRVSPLHYEYINVCSQKSDIVDKATHGTVCAMVLDNCTANYELINIQVTPNYSGNSIKTSGDPNELAKALDLCLNLDVDIVSMSAVTSLLSDSKKLYDKVKKLSEKVVIVAALDNAKFVTIPASYPFVIGVQNDSPNVLNVGEIAYNHDEIFNTDIVANCNFDFLREMDCFPSNSFAVPVAVAHINNLLNSEKLTSSEVFTRIKVLPEYAGSALLFSETVQTMRLMEGINPKPSALYIYIKAPDSSLCIEIMDWLYEHEDTQCCAIVDKTDKYDIRFCAYNPVLLLSEQFHRMEWFYKTDIVFVCDDGMLENSADYDAKLYYNGEAVTIEADGKRLSAPFDRAAETLYGTFDVDEG